MRKASFKQGKGSDDQLGVLLQDLTCWHREQRVLETQGEQRGALGEALRAIRNSPRKDPIITILSVQTLIRISLASASANET